MNSPVNPSKRKPKARKRGRENDARCHHFTRGGRRCRLPRLWPSAFCRLHADEDRDYVAASLGRTAGRGTVRSALRARRKIARYILERRLDAQLAPVLIQLSNILLSIARHREPRAKSNGSLRQGTGFSRAEKEEPATRGFNP